ncbi:phytase [Coprinopsis cinerea okayama7|uniref:Phytase n=1 Tax=Coprinopsis cinerea (strain Okayama-7 / 130 / ATCC MYA-4618 / FGSC 9003) TaxID=240176 RepID=A8P6U3_COPC7|nr:phytase [Coprinopsis cinerea okayama7\|eukprot:XP_001839228.2 phytase [Coprinopsis cinerea okayama7\
MSTPWVSAEAGAKTWERYRKLVRKGKAGLPFVRASGSERVIDSATNWTAGKTTNPTITFCFADANNNIFEPKLAVIIPEHLNDTLEDHMCPNAGTPEPQTAIWTEIFAQPIADRLNALAPGANLSAADAASLIPLCAFESVAMERPSRFCALFSGEEFEGYEYLADLEKYYNRGHGQPLGPVQGVGYINELLARLTNTPVHDHTSTNRTLTSSPHTFPLDRTIYADFSHDNLMVAVFSAMGLFRQDPEGRNGEVDGHLDPERMDRRRTWVTSRITPFSARMVVERMTCRGRVEGRVGEEDQEVFNGFIDEEEDEDDRVERVTKGKAKRRRNYVRVLVNDAVQPLEFCGGDGDGLCTLERFVDSQWYARKSGDGDWEKCFEGVEREGDF